MLRIAEIFLTALLVSAVGTWALIRFNDRLSLTAAPTVDRWHKRPTPNSGGLAILLACAVGYLLYLPGYSRLTTFLAACFSVLGFIDDRVRLAPLPKLAVQVVLTAVVIAAGNIFSPTPWYWFNAAVTLLWIVGITNAFNLIDNMDGLCAGVVVIVAAFRILLLARHGSMQEAGATALIAGAFFGFLLFNYHPAKIFMGDCGSVLAGFGLANLAISSPVAHATSSLSAIVCAALTFSYPIFDTALVSFLRRASGRPISIGGRDHSSHRLGSLGLGETTVVWLLWAMAALGGAAGLLLDASPLVIMVAALVTGILFLVFGMFLGTLPAYPVAIEAGMFGHGPILRALPVLRVGATLWLDGLLSAVSLISAFMLRWGTELPLHRHQVLVHALPIVALCHMVSSLVSRTFCISWRAFDIGDALRVGGAAALGGALAFGITVGVHLGEFTLGELLLYIAICSILSILVRASLRIMAWALGSGACHGERIGSPAR